MGALFSAATLLPIAGAGLLCTLRSIVNWVAGIRLLIVVTVFGGIISLHLGSGALLVLFRDIFVVVPLYVAFLSGRRDRESLYRLPPEVALALVFVLAYIGLSTLNTTANSLMQVLIGLKIWLFYIPFLAIGLALAARPGAMFSVFRTVLVCGMVACLIGLLQSVMVRVTGYHATMIMFFGDKAAAATQGFSQFGQGGGIYRIPGTFTFVTQYVNFLYLLLTVSVIESHADPAPRFRRFATAAMFITAFALLLSGSRATGLTVTAFFAGYFLFGLLRLNALSLAPVAVVAAWTVLQTIGFDPGALFTTGGRLIGFYARGFVVQQVQSALHYGAFGAGIGTSTNAARYLAAASPVPGIAGGGLGFESFYGKIAAELGVVGLVLMGGFFSTVFVRMSWEALKSRRGPANTIVAPTAIYIAYTIVTLFKGSTLDQDPANIFFWLLLGLALGVRRAMFASELLLEREIGAEALRAHPAE